MQSKDLAKRKLKMINPNGKFYAQSFSGSHEKQIAEQKTEMLKYRREEYGIGKALEPKGKLVRYPQDGDSFEIRKTQTKKVNKAHRSRRKKKTAFNVKATAAAVMATLTIAGGAKLYSDAQPPKANYCADNLTLSQVSDMTDVDYRAILLANESCNTDGALDCNIVLPQLYENPINERIDNIKAKLEKGGLSQKEKEKLKAELMYLEYKKDLQDELAVVYVDEENKYAYIIPNDYNCSSEELKEAFGIEDGVIRKYNSAKLSYEWASDGPEMGYYRDYTHASIPASGIKIPLDKLNTTY